MPRQRVVINVAGGWATDFGPSFTGAPQGNALSLPFLLNADNVTFELDGAPHKVGGASRLNSTQVTESATAKTFHGLYDAWFQGVAGSELQKRIAYVGTRLMKEDTDGTWDELTTGLEDSKQPCFDMFNDVVIWASTSTADVPQTWDGSASTTSALAGSPPNFAFQIHHKNREWASGVVTNPSRLYYAQAGTHNAWTGGDAGSIDIDPSDGDRITALASHKNELLVFKGPNKLSIHRITGSSPTGSDAFARVPFISGVGSINHNGVFRINDDLVFASPRGIHSLAATAAYGDYVEAFLARPILTYYQDNLNHSVLNETWGVNYQAKGLAIWSFAKSGSSAKNICLVYDYRFQPGRWISWGKDSAYVGANCLAILQTTARKHRLFAGTTDGYVMQLDIAARAINTTGAYTGDVKSPFLNFGSSAVLKGAAQGYQSLVSKGDYNMTFGWTRDTDTEQTATVAQSGGDTLG